MIREGILRVIGEICVNETDHLVLVCLIHFLFYVLLFALFGYIDCFTDAVVFDGSTVETYD